MKNRWVRLWSGLILIGLLPLASVLIAAGLAWIGNCRLNEAMAHPCVILGFDISELLYSMGVAGWLMLVTAPLAMIGIAGLVGLAVLRLARGR